MKLAMMMVLTPDLAEARRFYGQVLGFRVVAQDDRRLTLEHDGAAFQVFRCEDSAPAVRHGATAASVLVFGVADIDEAITQLTARGVRFIHERPAVSDLGRYAAFHAPGGNVHEIFQPAT